MRADAPAFLPLEADTPAAKKPTRDTADPSGKPPGLTKTIKQEPPTASKRTADGAAKRTAADTAKRPSDAASPKQTAAEAAVAVKKEEPSDGPPRTAHKRPREEPAPEASKAAGKVPRRTTAEESKATADAEAQKEPKRRKVRYACTSLDMYYLT